MIKTKNYKGALPPYKPRKNSETNTKDKNHRETTAYGVKLKTK